MSLENYIVLYNVHRCEREIEEKVIKEYNRRVGEDILRINEKAYSITGKELKDYYGIESKENNKYKDSLTRMILSIRLELIQGSNNAKVCKDCLCVEWDEFGCKNCYSLMSKSNFVDLIDIEEKLKIVDNTEEILKEQLVFYDWDGTYWSGCSYELELDENNNMTGVCISSKECTRCEKLKYCINKKLDKKWIDNVIKREGNDGKE